MLCSEMYDTVMCLCVVGTCWEVEKEMLEVEVVVVSSDLSENRSFSFINHFLAVKTSSCVDAAGRASCCCPCCGVICWYVVLTLTHPPCIPVCCAHIIQAAQDD